MFAVQSDASLKIFYALIADGRALATSGCGLRSSAARRTAIDLPQIRPANQLLKIFSVRAIAVKIQIVMISLQPMQRK
jgi:hypothetical protein